MGQRRVKLGACSGKGTILCSHKVDKDLGHRCLCTDDEGTAADPSFGKFRWTLVPTDGSDTYMISSSEFAGVLYVSEYRFQSEGLPMMGVYVREKVEFSVSSSGTLVPDPRQLWQLQPQGQDECHFVSVFNKQVLCVSSCTANSKGDRWLGVAVKDLAAPESYALSIQVLDD